MTGEHEAGAEAAHHAVDDRAPLRGAPLLEREQVDVEDVGHGVSGVGSTQPRSACDARVHLGPAVAVEVEDGALVVDAQIEIALRDDDLVAAVVGAGDDLARRAR